ncbi:MAG: methyltransferase domain-containing protein [Acidobacteriota bacterium]|jgi:SAM-dependent methyltransferase
MSGDDRAAPPHSSRDDGNDESPFHRWAKSVYRRTPWGLQRRLENQRADQQRAEERLSDAIQTIQKELTEIRDRRLDPLEKRVDNLEDGLRDVSSEINRLRDGVVPAAVARSDALLDRLAEELEEVASLAERSLRGEALPVADSPISDDRLAEALADVQPRLLESFRGSEEEIVHRLDRYLPDLQSSAPVLDLGSGRGELLLMLREAGVEAAGVEGDSALAEAARRRGLGVTEGDVLDILRGLEPESRGAVTAFHLFEHLQPTRLAAVLSEIRRVLKSGGLLIAECPNPHTVRVGASLYWQDPTHARPLLPETLELMLRASGLEPQRRELLHPFPPDQLLADDEGGTGAVTDPEISMLAERVDRLRDRLDEILHGPRDFAVWASKT